MAIVRARYAGKEHSKHIPGRVVKTTGPIPKEVIIEIGVPFTPTSGWTCGTDLIWPVLRIIEPPVQFIGSRAVVCRHEIEAGD